MRFIFTNQDHYFKDEYQEAWLSEETGWWEPDGNIWIWIVGQSKRQQIGIAVHEAFEYLAVHKTLRCLKRRQPVLFRLFADAAHNMANVLEFIASIGKADQYWGKQNWSTNK